MIKHKLFEQLDQTRLALFRYFEADDNDLEDAYSIFLEELALLEDLIKKEKE